jgi:hypothetical protein
MAASKSAIASLSAAFIPKIRWSMSTFRTNQYQELEINQKTREAAPSPNELTGPKHPNGVLTPALPAAI